MVERGSPWAQGIHATNGRRVDASEYVEVAGSVIAAALAVSMAHGSMTASKTVPAAYTLASLHPSGGSA